MGKSQPYGWDLCLFALVLFPGGHAAADMALLFIDIQNFSYLKIQCVVVVAKPLGKILMYR